MVTKKLLSKTEEKSRAISEYECLPQGLARSHSSATGSSSGGASASPAGGSSHGAGHHGAGGDAEEMRQASLEASPFGQLLAMLSSTVRSVEGNFFRTWLGFGACPVIDGLRFDV